MSTVQAVTDDLATLMAEIGRRSRAAANTLAFAAPAAKARALHAAADALDDRRDDILSANSLDMRAAEHKGISKAFLDRLLLTD